MTAVFIEDLSNRRFGKWTALQYAGPYKGRNGDKKSMGAAWTCRCDCGVEQDVRASHLRHNKSKGCKSCQAYEREAIRNRPRKTIPARYGQYKAKARERGYAFSLSIEEFSSLLTSNCYYCATPPVKPHPTATDGLLINGIDRLDSSAGYTVENCVSACFLCNRAKNTLTLGAFVEHVFKITAHQLAQMSRQ